MRRISRAIRWAATIPLLSGVLAAQSGDQAAIQQALNSQIQLTTTTADRSDIANAGSVVELRKDGLAMYGTTSPLPQSNIYKNGRISGGAGGFGKDLLFSMSAQGGGESYPQRKFMVGERCWVTGVTVQKDGVLFKLYSDPVDGIRYYGNLKILFPNKKEVPQVDAAMQIIGEVLALVSPDGQSGQQIAPQEPSAPEQPPPGTSNGNPASPSVPAPSISIGQTREEVTAAFGEPMRKAVIGSKEIYAYKDMKVIFINGKVSDVQ